MATDTGPTGATVARPADVGLRREIGLVGATWASETSIIGSGWLFGAFGAATAAGTAALLGWVIGGVIVVILALVHAELGGMYPVAGGTARFPHLAFGSGAGISFGFFSWLQAVTVAPIECFAVMQYASYYWHGLYDSKSANVTGLGFAMTVILMALFTAINFLAVKLFSQVNSGITWWKVAIPVLTIIVLAFKFHGNNLDVGGGFMPYGIKALFAAIPSAGIVFAYLGFEQADQLAGEVKNPQKNLPRAILLATGIGILIYCLLQLVFIGAMPHNLISGPKGWAGVPSTNPIAIGPFAGLAGAVALGWLAVLLRIDAFVSPFGTGLIYQTSTSRVGYGLARNRYYPQVFQWVDRNGIPWFSLIMSFVFGLFFLLPFPSWHSLVGLVTGASVLMYAGAPLSLGAFRRQVPDAPRPYRMPGAVVMAPLAFILANMLIYWSGFNVIWKLGVCLAIGYILIGIFMAMDPQRPPIDWRAAQWLPVYLIGMGLISWFGQFGSGAPPINNGRLPFWWDILTVAAFSLVIYYWAQAVRLPRAEVERLVELQSARMGDVPDMPRH
ncbi:MAG: APC family permease [Streptosporangiaceae bacterium]|nr:APC family permease [Streptosporangiaceae bacterium]MBV9854655.1 APC family permease [Streptosporangiaceae bacterium]